jgi:hypothetical protein
MMSDEISRQGLPMARFKPSALKRLSTDAIHGRYFQVR